MSKFIHALRLSLASLVWIWRTALARGNSALYNTLTLHFTRCAYCDKRWSDPGLLYCQPCLAQLAVREQESTLAMQNGIDHHENYHEEKTEEHLHLQASTDYAFSTCTCLTCEQYCEAWISGYHSVVIGKCHNCWRVTRVHEVAGLELCGRCIAPSYRVEA